jgi:capsular polysaccharide biosynthesis protein
VSGSITQRKLSSRAVTAGDVYRALWRHKWFILVLTAVCVGAASYATAQQTQAYEASTLVRAQERGPLAGDAGVALQASQDLAQTYARMIRSGALAGDIKTLVATCIRLRASSARRPGTPSSAPAETASAARATSCAWLVGRRRTGLAPGTISKAKLTADNVQDLDLLSITARSENPRNALIAAAAAPEALRAFIRRTAPSSERIVTVKAPTSSSPVSRHLALNGTIALMLGLIFSGALALLLELFRDRLPDADELEEAVGHPVLGTIPTLRFRQGASPSQEGTGPTVAMGRLDGESAPRPAGSEALPEQRV